MIRNLKNIFFNFGRMIRYLRFTLLALIKGIILFKLKFKGMLSLPESVILYDLASFLPENSTIIEIGCYDGLSTACLLKGGKNKSKIYSIDPFNFDISAQRRKIIKSMDEKYKFKELCSLKNKPSKKKVKEKLVNQGLTNFFLIQDYSYNVIPKWEKEIDLLWIDGNHEYEEVRKDFLQWSKHLKTGGIIVFHDANKKSKNYRDWEMGWDGPTKVVREYIKTPKWLNIGKVDSIVYATKNYA